VLPPIWYATVTVPLGKLAELLSVAALLVSEAAAVAASEVAAAVAASEVAAAVAATVAAGACVEVEVLALPDPQPETVKLTIAVTAKTEEMLKTLCLMAHSPFYGFMQAVFVKLSSLYHAYFLSLQQYDLHK